MAGGPARHSPARPLPPTTRHSAVTQKTPARMILRCNSLPHLQWIVAANVLLGAAVALLLLTIGLSIQPFGLLLAGFGIVGLGVVHYVYEFHRSDERLAAIAAGFAVLIAFTHVGAACSYAVTAVAFPLRDAQFAAIDAFFGFDWQYYLTLTAAHPALAGLLRGAYASSLPQTLGLVIILGTLRQGRRLAGFLWLFMITGTITIIVSGLLPAAGPVVFHDPPVSLRRLVGEDAGAWHLPHFNDLRNGTLRVIDFAAVEGLVTFPSFHTALAIICSWALWPIRYLRWPAVLLNVLVIASTPSIGGHYLIDVIAGALVAVGAILALPRSLVRLPKPCTLPA
jgi:membrane-associated phospholipid phosphatase